MKTHGIKMQLIALLIFVVILSGCKCNSSRINMENDKNEALAVTGKFYWHLTLHEYAKVNSLFSRDFFKSNDSVKFDSSLVNIQKKYGNIKSSNLIDCSSTVINGSNSSTDYRVLYSVIYNNDSTKEFFRLEKIDYKVKIVEYTINHNELK
jgi:hypothetical protein